MAKSRAAVQVADRRFELSEFDIPRIGSDDGLLRIESCGMCGSDVEQYEGALKAIGVNYPVIPGHEPFGFIEEIGASAARRWGVEKGDRVVVEPLLGCGHCRACLTGNYRRCRTGRPGAGIAAYGYVPTQVAPALWGGYAEYMYLDPRSVLHKVSAELPAELVALYQPMAAGIRWAVQEPGTKLGDTVVILGCGQRGLTSIVAVREAGVGKVIVTGLKSDTHKLALARELGADATIIADQEDTVARVRELTDGEGADVVVDVTAVSVQPITDAIEIAKAGATIIIAGVKGSGQAVPNFVSDKLLMKELTIKGVLSQDLRAFEPALKLIHSRKYPLERMHTHTFGLQDIDLAVRTLAGHVEGAKAIHVMVAPQAG
jgi:threonine dehydrogenase-like Zn-dependent dehydrogenase